MLSLPKFMEGKNGKNLNLVAVMETDKIKLGLILPTLELISALILHFIEWVWDNIGNDQKGMLYITLIAKTYFK